MTSGRSFLRPKSSSLKGVDLAEKLSLAREVAYDSFVKVMDGGALPEVVLGAFYAKYRALLRPLDYTFIKELLFGGFRWYSKIHWILSKTAKRDLNALSPEVRASLILGAYQIFYMDRVPDRAAVNESVNYIRCRSQTRAAGFVNGVLRAIARRAEYFAKPDKEKRPVEYLALQYAHPEWMVARWLARYGFERTKSILTANNHVPPCTIRVNCLKVAPNSLQNLRSELLRDNKLRSYKRPIRSGLRLSGFPHVERDPHFRSGYYTIQDEASQLISPLLDPQEGDVIVDACSGRGGKTGHLFELSAGKATIIAVEPSALRVKQAQEAMRRLGHRGIRWAACDFGSFRPEIPVNKVIIDAPCSGLGVLRRHPEGKWRKKKSAIVELQRVQRRLLEHGLAMLPVGGTLVYAVCSFEEEEVDSHLRYLLSSKPAIVELISPASRLPDYYKRFVTREGLLTVYSSNKDHMDGFSAFVVKKIADRTA